MNEFKYQFVNILLLALLGFGIYWAFSTIDNGIIYDKDLVVDTNIDNKDSSQTDLVFDNTKPKIPTSQIENTVPEKNTPEPSVQGENETPKTLSADEQYLVSKLEGLINDKIQMKKNSHGTRVGTVQKFLNLYLEKQVKVDNQYGSTTIARVKEFQQKEGLSADGFAGINTYKKMIEVLKK